jgi:hypothetical protein
MSSEVENFVAHLCMKRGKLFFYRHLKKLSNKHFYAQRVPLAK